MVIDPPGLKIPPRRRPVDSEPRNDMGFTQHAPLIGTDLSCSGRCTRLAHGMGCSRQSVYRHLHTLMQTEVISKAEALTRLEARYLRGADQ